MILEDFAYGISIQKRENMKNMAKLPRPMTWLAGYILIRSNYIVSTHTKKDIPIDWMQSPNTNWGKPKPSTKEL